MILLQKRELGDRKTHNDKLQNFSSKNTGDKASSGKPVFRVSVVTCCVNAHFDVFRCPKCARNS